MKYDSKLILVIFESDEIISKISELLSFIKISHKSTIKNYIVDMRICTRRTLDKKLKKLEELKLIEINKNNIVAKHRLLQIYKNNIRIHAKYSQDIVYKTNALLLIYTIMDGCISSIYTSQHLLQRRIYQVNDSFILCRIYLESNIALTNRLKFILNEKGYNDKEINVYIPIVYKKMYSSIMEPYEEFNFNFIFY